MKGRAISFYSAGLKRLSVVIMKILITGGAGYIGSHTVLLLLENGYEVVVVDNFSNSSIESINRVQRLTGKTVRFYECDINDRMAMTKVFSENEIASVIHFAGLKAVGESVSIPLKYYENNISGTITLLDVMIKNNVKRIVFSSSATVYGDPKKVPITEDCDLSATNPYGRTKLFLEEILTDTYISDNDFSISLLRYFNPAGAHESGEIGEDPKGIPNNLMPYITQVASGKLKELSIFGDDYNTPDGTGVRDYIHVMDLAAGHLKAIEYISDKKGVFVHNLGTGIGYSVLDIVKAFESANNINIPYKIAARRPGDVAACYADPKKASEELLWTAKKGIEDMCRDSWNWQSKNPQGYISN